MSAAKVSNIQGYEIRHDTGDKDYYGVKPIVSWPLKYTSNRATKNPGGSTQTDVKVIAHAIYGREEIRGAYFADVFFNGSGYSLSSVNILFSDDRQIADFISGVEGKIFQGRFIILGYLFWR